MKKKILTAALTLLMSVSAFSCGNEDASSTCGETLPETEITTNEMFMKDDSDAYSGSLEELEAIIGSEEEKDYQDFVGTDYFNYMLMNYTDPNNGLDLKNGVPENPVVVKPFKSILVDERIEPTPINIWTFPIVDNGSFIAFMCLDCRDESVENNYYGGAMYADELNTVVEQGKFVIFQPVADDGIYAIYENDEIVPLYDSKPYDGLAVTFEELSSFGYVIDENSVNDIIYEIDDIVFNN